MEGDANCCLVAVVTKYMHAAMKRDKKQFYSRIVLGGMFDVPPSTLNKLLSGTKYMGGAELEKYCEEMKSKGVDIPKRGDMKVGGRKKFWKRQHHRHQRQRLRQSRNLVSM